jgi:hypothetical protein
MLCRISGKNRYAARFNDASTGLDPILQKKEEGHMKATARIWPLADAPRSLCVMLSFLVEIL